MRVFYEPISSATGDVHQQRKFWTLQIVFQSCTIFFSAGSALPGYVRDPIRD
jgi:hypothetical protein